MADQRYFQHTLDNGLTLVCERMAAMQSAAMSLLIPAGAATDPPAGSGASTVLCEWVLRGAGTRNSRQLSEHLDTLGLQRSSSASIHHTRFTTAAVAARVLDGLEVYADIVRRPMLPEDGFAASRDLALHALAGLDDEPRQKVLVKLREQHFPWPFGRSAMGKREELEQLQDAGCRAHHARCYQPQGAILALAGNIDFAQVRDTADRLFGDWPAVEQPPPTTAPPPGDYHHIEHKSEQTHIGLAYPSILETDPDFYPMRLAMEVLGGGMSGRLFTEIREKRALVYNVWAGYSGLKGYGSILGYAGTSNERAQETLDTFIAELNRLSDGITPDELERARIGLKAGTIMQGESTSARAGAIAHDFFMHGRIRSLEEIKTAIENVTLDQVNDFVARSRPERFTIVTIGPAELKRP